MLAAAPQPAGEADDSDHICQHIDGECIIVGCTKPQQTEPAPSAPSPGDALSLDGAASRETADVEALALIVDALEQSQPFAHGYLEARKRHADALQAARRLSGARQAAMDSDIGPCDPTASTAPLLTAPEPTCASVA